MAKDRAEATREFVETYQERLIADGFISQCNEMVTVERADGSRYENIRALVAKEVLISEDKIPIAPNDVILRQLPSGLVERLIVSDPGFHAKSSGAPAHYQVKYHREGQAQPSTPGHVFHVSGNNARLNFHSMDNSANYIDRQTSNLSLVGEELTRLRETLLKHATDAEHYAAIGAIASAKLSAKKGDASAVASALAAIGNAGKWVLDGAKEIGVGVAAKVIEDYVGLPPGSA